MSSLGLLIAGPQLSVLMDNFIKNPKLRSEKWISTSILQENWDKDVAKLASAEYFTNNLLVITSLETLYPLKNA